MIGGPLYNTYICEKWHGTVLGEFIRNARTERYNIILFIDAHEKCHSYYFYDGISGGGDVLPSNSTTEALVSLSATINSIDCWRQVLEHNYLERSNMFLNYKKYVSEDPSLTS